ncbi:hypothetical protein [Litchfieldella qijiaojingensis]|uniref:hypothetical protein n=1 Tax=Litchfieldella qijiaojingensis TaxID=980347 RepID=UPI00167AFBAF|nr:hypothetical protein [Halomonas qijiaojingensis]
MKRKVGRNETKTYTAYQNHKGLYIDGGSSPVGSYDTKNPDFVRKDGRWQSSKGTVTNINWADSLDRTGDAYANGWEGKAKVDVTNTVYDTKTSYQTKTDVQKDRSLKALDRLDNDEEDGKKRKADIKKKGRSKLRIQLKADPSAGRLKDQPVKKDKKAGAQGGGKSGLNIPR